MHLITPLPPHAQHCAEGSATPIPCLLCSNPRRITVLKPCLLHPEKGLRRREVTYQGPCRLCPAETRLQDIAASGAGVGAPLGRRDRINELAHLGRWNRIQGCHWEWANLTRHPAGHRSLGLPGMGQHLVQSHCQRPCLERNHRPPQSRGLSALQ